MTGQEQQPIDLGWFRKLRARGATEAYDAIVACAQLRHWPARTRIYAAGDRASWLCAIQSGHVEVRLSNASKSLSLTTLGAGDLLGEMSIIEPHVRTAEVRTLGDPVEARVILFDDLERLRRRHPEIDRVLVEVLMERVRRLSDDMAKLTLLPSTREMVRRWVLDRARRDDEGLVHLSQQAVADSVGLSRDTVGDYLAEDIRSGRIAKVQRRRAHVLQVPDTAALRAAIEADAAAT